MEDVIFRESTGGSTVHDSVFTLAVVHDVFTGENFDFLTTCSHQAFLDLGSNLLTVSLVKERAIRNLELEDVRLGEQMEVCEVVICDLVLFRWHLFF